MKKFLSFVGIFSFATLLVSEPCLHVRMADVGWTDVSATTALAEQILKALKYKPSILLDSLPNTFLGLKNKSFDIFLGNWMPAQALDVEPFLRSGSVIQLQQNLSGARYTLAVPDYVYAQGVRTLSDLNRYASFFNKQIYALERGNDGNRIIQSILTHNNFDLGSWDLIESHEQSMFLEVKAAIEKKQWIVFLAWSPHPMNMTLPIKYLDGGDEFFGDNFGFSSVSTLARRDFAQECTNLANFFRNLIFTVDIENKLMSLILEKNLSPEAAAQEWLRENPTKASSWVKDIRTADGGLAQHALVKYIRMLNDTDRQNPRRLALGRLIEQNLTMGPLSFISEQTEVLLNTIVTLIIKLPWLLIISLISIFSFYIRRSFIIALLIFSGLLLIINMGLWQETIQTIVLVMLTSSFCMILALIIAFIASKSSNFWNIISPLIDFLHALHPIVMTIMTLLLFSVGFIPGLIMTVIFAVSAPIKLTYLGIKANTNNLLKVSGESELKIFLRVGFTKSVMVSLSMIIIAALVGVEGLGTPLLRALMTVNIALGFEAGIALIIIAIAFDQTLRLVPKPSGLSHE